MKNLSRIICLLLLLSLTISSFAGCEDTQQTPDPTLAPFVDYVAQTKLNMNTDSLKQEVTVKSFIDGDTTHFYVPTSVCADGILKARYLAVNTPESTGKIEEWGKKASNFTKEKLSGAVSIIIESDDDKWNVDSTGDRHLVWVWYKSSADADYRCLNLELVQNGLSAVGGTPSLRYGSATTNAFLQAGKYKLNLFSGEADPDFYYGDAYEITLKQLRTNIKLYENRKVAFEGVVTRNNNNSVYVEEFDPETEVYYGITVYYGFETGAILNTLQVGNRIRVVGSVQYYEAGGTWQVSDVTYRPFKPNDPGNTLLVSEGHTAGNPLVDAQTFTQGKVEVEVMETLDSEETTTETISFAQAAMSTSIRMQNLVVKDIYTTSNGGDNDGAMTLTCEVDGITLTVRTVVLRKESGEKYVESDFLNKTIDVTGVIDYYAGEYQIKVFTPGDIIIHE